MEKTWNSIWNEVTHSLHLEVCRSKMCSFKITSLSPLICISDQQGSGTATAGVFTYFFWVLLQPFRGNPEYRDVADLPYNSTCLNSIRTMHTDMKSLSKCFFILPIFIFGQLYISYFLLQCNVRFPCLPLEWSRIILLLA